MLPERELKLRRILRLAELLSDDERVEYLAAITGDDEELRRAVDVALRKDASLVQTLIEYPRPPPRFGDASPHPNA